MKYLIRVAILAVLTLSSCNQKVKVDLLIHNGVIYTIDSAFSVQEAMAIKDKRIIAIGKNEEIGVHGRRSWKP